MRQTYNPISGPFDTPPPPRPGTAVVVGSLEGFSLRETVPPRLLAAPGALSVRPHDAPAASDHLATIGRSAWKGSVKLFKAARRTSFGRKYLGGQPLTYFLVETSRKNISDEFTLPSREGTLHFVASVTCDVRIADPVRAIEEGITDVRAHLATELRRRLARVAAAHSAFELTEAQNRMQAIFERPITAAEPIDRTVHVERVHIMTQLDPDAQKWLREKEVSGLRKNAVEAVGSVEEAARRSAAAASRTLDDLMAQWLATSEDRYRVAMEIRVAGMRAGDENRLALLKVMLENHVIEPHDVHARFPEAVGRLLGGSLLDAPAATATPTRAIGSRVEIRLPKRS